MCHATLDVLKAVHETVHMALVVCFQGEIKLRVFSVGVEGLLNELTKGKQGNREQNGTKDGTLWDPTGESSRWRGIIACVDGETSMVR